MFEELRPQSEPPPPTSAYADAVKRGQQLRFRRRARLTGGTALIAAVAAGVVFGVPFGGTGGSSVQPADPTGTAAVQNCATESSSLPQNPMSSKSTLAETALAESKEPTMNVPTGTAVRTAIAAAGLAALAGCSTPVAHGGTEPTTPSSSASSPSTAGSPAGTGSAASPSSPTHNNAGAGKTAGCAATSRKIPAGASVTTTDDVDHDGRSDRLWLVDVGNDRTLGIRTASGATFSTTFTSAAPQQANALGARLGDGSSIILLNTGRSVSLYAVVNCAIVPTQNKQGAQYTFDLGFTGYGTGVGCLDVGSGLELFGLDAREKGSSTSYDIYRTSIVLSDAGRKAANGTQSRTAAGVSTSSAAFDRAHTVSCGSAAQVTEPLP